MVQRKRHKNRKWLGKVLFLVLLVFAGAVGYLVWDSYFKNKEVETGRESETIIEKPVTNEAVEAEKNEVVKKEKVEQYDGEDPNVKDELTGVITYTGVLNNEIVIRVNIDQYLAEGNCYLALSKNDVVVYDAMVEIVDSAATATCAGFNIPVAGLGEGDFGIVINVKSGNKEGVISGEVRV